MREGRPCETRSRGLGLTASRGRVPGNVPARLVGRAADGVDRRRRRRPHRGERPRLCRWTRDEYIQMSEWGWFIDCKVELIGGEVIEMAAQFNAHAAGVTLTADALRVAFGPGYWVRSQATIDLSPHGMPDPDVAVVPEVHAPPRGVAFRRPHCSWSRSAKAPSALIAIVMASLYAAGGIADYWIVNLVQRQPEVHRNPVADPSRAFGFWYADRTHPRPRRRNLPVGGPDSACVRCGSAAVKRLQRPESGRAACIILSPLETSDALRDQATPPTASPSGPPSSTAERPSDVVTLRKALEGCGVVEFLDTPNFDDIDAAQFDRRHRQWCLAVVDSLEKAGIANVTFGRAAKLIAIYLKSVVVLGPSSGTAFARIAHPPIDSILLRNLAASMWTCSVETLVGVGV